MSFDRNVSYNDLPLNGKNLPNAATLKALDNIEKGKDLDEAKDAQDMFHKLGI